LGEELGGVAGGEVAGAGASTLGFMSVRASAGGGRTVASETPQPAWTISEGMPRSLASDMTLCAGDDSRVLLGVEGALPVRSARFSASSSTTRASSQARWALRWLRLRWADSRLRIVLASRRAFLARSSSVMFCSEMSSSLSSSSSSWSSSAGEERARLAAGVGADAAAGRLDDDAALGVAADMVGAGVVVGYVMWGCGCVVGIL
jgi:hypothetical protein